MTRDTDPAIGQDGDPYSAPTRAVDAPKVATQMEVLSRSVVAAEALLLLLPVSALAGLWMFAFAASVASSPTGFQPLLFFTAIVAAYCVVLGAAWWIVGRFVLRGRPGLASAGRVPWGLVHAGAAITATGVALWSLAFFRRADSGGFPFGELEFALLGVPLLAPYLHLLLERRLARRGG